MKRNVIISISLPAALVDKVEEVAERMGITRSMCIRMMIQNSIGDPFKVSMKAETEEEEPND